MSPKTETLAPETTSRKRAEKYKGTVFLAESGRTAFMQETLKGLGFFLRGLVDQKAGGAVPEPAIFILDSAGWRAQKEEINSFIASSHYLRPVIMIDDGDYGDEAPECICSLMNEHFTERQMLVAVREAFRSASLHREIELLRGTLDSGHSDLQKLIEIGISLSSERNIDRLMDKILEEACNVTTADAGSIYIIDASDSGESVLRFRNTRGYSIKTDFKEFSIPIGPDSIAGYVALTGESLILDDCYHIPPQYRFSINRSFDESNNYRTKSMLAVAMRNQKDEITGVIQLINRKPALDLVLSSPQVAEEQVIPFDERSRNLIGALASQAAVALENYRLYQEIEKLFEGFVQASVTAIESRDPTTCGHSERVATLTVGIAELVNRTGTGRLRQAHFSDNQIKEIRYASLLHDFGKVGVREHVLLKAKKLYPQHLELIKQRFDIARQIFRKETSRNKMELLLQAGREDYLARFGAVDADLTARLILLDEYLQQIVTANEPTVLVEENFSRLEEIARTVIADADEGPLPLLVPEEHLVLRIPKGSLTSEERHEIESHVTHSFNFLVKIPWTSELKNIPEIAHGHHEKLDGSGYPLGISAERICLQTRMMTISDIYDALTATDRPYKPAVPPEKALDILGWEVDEGKIDPDLFRVFRDGRVWELTSNHPA